MNEPDVSLQSNKFELNVFFVKKMDILECIVILRRANFILTKVVVMEGNK